MTLKEALRRKATPMGGEDDGGDDSDGQGGNPTTGDSDDGRQYNH